MEKLSEKNYKDYSKAIKEQQIAKDKQAEAEEKSNKLAGKCDSLTRKCTQLQTDMMWYRMHGDIVCFQGLGCNISTYTFVLFTY